MQKVLSQTKAGHAGFYGSFWKVFSPSKICHKRLPRVFENPVCVWGSLCMVYRKMPYNPMHLKYYWPIFKKKKKKRKKNTRPKGENYCQFIISLLEVLFKWYQFCWYEYLILTKLVVNLCKTLVIKIMLQFWLLLTTSSFAKKSRSTFTTN